MAGQRAPAQDELTAINVTSLSSFLAVEMDGKMERESDPETEM